MCAELFDAIREVVEGKVSNRELFTAFEITKLIRANGMSEYHSTVRGIVHDGFNLNDWMPGYDCVAFRLGNNGEARVYFPQGENPMPYVDAVRQAIADEEQTATSSPTDPLTPSKVDNVFTPAKDGRMRITKGILEAAGFDAFDEIYAYSDGDDIILTDKMWTVPADKRHSYSIDAYTNVKISPSVFGFSKNNSYEVKCGANVPLVVSPVNN
jgi:hypothetical protein